MGVATDGTYATYGDLWVISVSNESHPFLPPYIMVFLVNL
jgi:hypothetical protein